MDEVFLVITASFMLFTIVACDSTGPSEPDFLISSIVFTGDSTGTEPAEKISVASQLRGTLSVPLCEFTLDWEEPFPDTRFEYIVFRSEEPSIQSDPSEANELIAISQNNWSDSDGLEWGTDYYYAVKAIQASGGANWSNEVCVTSPESPFPEAALLNMEKIGFSLCSLQWTEWPDEGFQAYILLRSYLSDIEHNPEYTHDTLFTATDRYSLTFTDSTVAGVYDYYYVLVTRNTIGLDSFSNEVHFVPGADIPWRVTKTIWPTSPSDARHQICIMSRAGDYYFESSYGDWPDEDFFIVKRSSGSGYILKGTTCVEDASTELLNGNIAVAQSTFMYVPELTIFSSDLLEITSIYAPVICSMVDTPGGILASGTASSWLYDSNTLEVLETFPNCRFDEAVLSPDGSRVYQRIDGYGIIGLLLPDFEIFGEVPVSYQSIICGSDGNLYCANETETAVYSGTTLELIDEFDFPESSTPLQGVSFLLPECRYLYGWNIQTGTDQEGLTVHVLDTEAKTLAGTISPGNEFLSGPDRFFSTPDGCRVWMDLQTLDSSCLMKLGI